MNIPGLLSALVRLLAAIARRQEDPAQLRAVRKLKVERRTRRARRIERELDELEDLEALHPQQRAERWG